MMKFGGSLARNMNFEVPNFRLLLKTRRKTPRFDLQIVQIAGSLARKARFEVSTCLLWSLCLRRVHGGSCKAFRFPMCPSVKIGGPLARNAPFEVSTCLVWSLCLRRVYGEAAKPFVVHRVKVLELDWKQSCTKCFF